MSRRPLPLLALCLTFTALLTACGGGTADVSTSPTLADEPTEEVAFPVTIDHRYGATEITERPERVVTVGLTDHDAFLAMGVAPVGTTDWYGDHPHAVWPWAEDELGDAEPQIVGDAQELDVERIAALEPDVIVGLYAALTQEQYDTLSQIAPTVAQPGDHVDYGIPWQELTRTVGAILGELDQAEQHVTDIEDRLATVRDEHPEFAGATSSIAAPYEGIYVYSFDVANGRLLSSLGFEQPDDLAELIGDSDGTSLSLERVELLDVDVLIWLDATPETPPLNEELYQRLDVHRDGREVFISSASEVGGAMSFSSVLSLPFLLDELVPMLEAAVDDDARTSGPDGE